MENNERMSNHSNLMLVEIIYGTSGKYNQDDVLSAELELSLRNVDDYELEVLKNKVAYIGGINLGGSSASGSPTSSSDSSNVDKVIEEDDDTGELEGMDSTLVKVLMVYLGITALSSFSGVIYMFFHLSIHSLLSIVTLGIYVYAIYGLLNRLSKPIILLIGLLTYGIVNYLMWIINSFISPGQMIYFFALATFNGAILYFLTKPSMRSAYKLDNESIKVAMIAGAAAAGLFKIIAMFTNVIM